MHTGTTDLGHFSYPKQWNTTTKYLRVPQSKVFLAEDLKKSMYQLKPSKDEDRTKLFTQ